MKPFEMSVETSPMVTEKNGFHLGTDEAIARQICEERYHGRLKLGLSVVTVALMREGHIVDVFDGKWAND